MKAPLFFSRLYKLPIFRFVLFGVVAWTSLALQGDKVWYQEETTIGVIQGTSGRPVAKMSASAGTIINYNAKGTPNFIAFADPKGTIQGKYGITMTGPENKGRLLYKQVTANEAIPYVVVGAKDIYTYHLKYLELTTASADSKIFVAYATKAIAFDNRVDTLSKQLDLTFKLPEGGYLVVDRGKLKFGENLINPNYDLTGKIP
jgi:hypothetical protein